MAAMSGARRGTRLGTRLGAGAGLLLLTQAVIGCAAEPVVLDDGLPTATPTPKGVGLPEDPVVLLEAAEGTPEIKQVGSADVTIDVVDLSDGVVEVAKGRRGGAALDFPTFRGEAETYPRAVVTVSNAGAKDQLSPGIRDFIWGGDFKIDKLSYGPGVDNGDNLVQRGISSQPTLFKAEIDKDRAACTVRGDEGELIVRARERVRPGWWYRVRCERTLNELGVYVTEYDPDGLVNTYARRVNGPIGDVTMVDATTPLTVGGKVGSDLELLNKATDQFNGLVMNPYYALGTG
jgi:hypothetical protein